LIGATAGLFPFGEPPQMLDERALRRDVRDDGLEGAAKRVVMLGRKHESVRLKKVDCTSQSGSLITLLERMIERNSRPRALASTTTSASPA
jgi:hypothetical protein